ncbi:MAG TPA: hypothetical protein DDZ80_32600 [Cyanobacteria bacterium UBA8803]|nr:hypothetical protein [Cyanobacteria bacterium UBA9273]HBL62940.1 hypothetical protein [Cyanobacteria bacterium UBA8803]
MGFRYTLASAVTIASAIAFNSTAVAQTVDVPFSGTVPLQATFINITPGTTETTPSGKTAGSLNKIESLTPALVTVQSSNPANITVSPPTLVSGPTPDPPGTNRIGFLQFGSTEVRSDIGGGTAPLPIGNTELKVDMLVERPETFTQGTYTYVVTLTITP